MKYIVSSGGYSSEQYNVHEHKDYEIVYYISGCGTLWVDGNQINVKKGNVLIIPPRVKHSSKSTENLRFMSIIGNSDGLLHLTSPVVFLDDENDDGFSLSQMVLGNRYGNQEFFNALCRAYILYVLKKVKISSEIEKAVYEIKKKITVNFCDSSFDVTATLNESGYAEDYIRFNFKKILGKTPVELLTEMRINNAKSLINVYQNSMSLLDIAIHSGFDDYIYFSRKFKMLSGMSPQSYKKKVLS